LIISTEIFRKSVLHVDVIESLSKLTR